ncbi:MAG: hypothetical protein EPO07_19715 [Verrucomicrobia bacterium]|nr:MAG: hypothetical protein EPO07_19715 [Verrucomicrobiota bacterium]
MMLPRPASNRLRAIAIAGLVALSDWRQVSAQTLNLPPRAADALTGTQFTNVIASTASPTSGSSEREYWIYAQVLSGNVPNWLRTLKPINTSISGHTATYYVAPDYLAIGSDQDYFLMPTTPLLAQRLGDRLGCTLPTRKMVGQIWTNATAKLEPVTFSPSTFDILSLDVFGSENASVRALRDFQIQTNSQPLGALVGGDKKDVIISTLIYSNLHTGVPKPVVIYGWHRYLSPNYGVEWQPLYNGHEETYADYSHGARFVQLNLTVDGSANTVTNVLTSAALAGLLSDESVAPSFTIPLPRYTVAPLAPYVLIHPRSQTVFASQNVSFTNLSTGDGAIGYRWQFNGAFLSNATNVSLALTNVQSANAGNYAVVVTNSVGSVTSRVAVLRVRTNSFPLLFRDDFETNSSANWNVFAGYTNGVPDFTVDWAFDHGAIPYTFNALTTLIPPAPNSPDGSAHAVRLTVNNNDALAAIAAVNLYPKNFSVSNNFALKFDLWLNYVGNANGFIGGISATGSTQHAICGINHLGTNVNWAPPSAPASDGLWFAVDGEGGTSADYRAYEGNLAGTQIDRTSTLSASNNAATIYQNLFPASRFETAGSPGKRWVEVELRQTNNIVLWIMDGAVISQRTNTTSFTNGNVMIGLMDLFNSIAYPTRDQFALFDNVRAENLSPPPIGFSSVTRLGDGTISLSLTSAPNDTLWLEASADLAVWQTLAVLTTTNAIASFTDLNAPTFSTRFYRAHR